MKKLFLLFTFIFLLFGCGDEEKTEVKPVVEEKVIPYSFYEKGSNSVKFQGIVNLQLTDDKIPDLEQMKEVAKQLITKNPKFENYFFRFEFPFGQKRPEKNAMDFQLYYNINKLGDNDFEIQPLYQQMTFYDITLKENVINKIGINKISSISPIKINDSIEEIVKKLGSPSEKEEDRYYYYIVNERNQMFGILYLEIKENKVSNVGFYSNNINFTENQLKELKEYVLGNKKLEDLNIRELKDIYPFTISGEDFKDRWTFSRLSLGDVDEIEYLIKDNGKTFDFIVPANGENYVKYGFNYKNDNLEKIVIVSENNTDKNYDDFLWDISRALAVLDPECNFLIERNNILGNLDFLYDQFSSSKNYKKNINEGKYKFNIQKKKNKTYLTISENK